MALCQVGPCQNERGPRMWGRETERDRGGKGESKSKFKFLLFIFKYKYIYIYDVFSGARGKKGMITLSNDYFVFTCCVRHNRVNGNRAHDRRQRGQRRTHEANQGARSSCKHNANNKTNRGPTQERGTATAHPAWGSSPRPQG